MCTDFQAKQTTLTFFDPNLSKNEFKVRNCKNYCWNKINILEIPFVPIFWQNKQLLLLGPKFAQKWNLGLEFQKSKYGFSIRTSKTPFVPIFTQNGQFWIFWPKFREIAQLRAIFMFGYCWGCCRELHGGWNDLGGGGWRWMEVGARFSNNCFEKYSSQAKFKTTYIFKPNIFKWDDYILIRKVFFMTTRIVNIIK